MEYTVQKLSKIAGISNRTIRYYDEIGILKPAKINSSGYRIYGEKELNKLQQILFYKEFDLNLDVIQKIINNPNFDRIKALKCHKEKLICKKIRLNLLIANIDKSIEEEEGGIKMDDSKKFEGFKKNIIDENEEKHGKIIRKEYGDKVINETNEKLMNMSKKEFEKNKVLGEKIINTLLEAYKTGNPSCELAQKAASMHKEWLSAYWNFYSEEAHAQVAQLYVDDKRFTEYYDKHQKGLSEFLRNTIYIFTGKDKEQ